jgi:peptidoglycan/xylan/chitin deacetylase (PgdA/CDA1 family)
LPRFSDRESIKQLVKTKRFENSLVCLLVLVSTGCFRFHHVGSPKLVALTFDDGPYGEATNQILDILKKEQVHATFFLLGLNVEKYPAITKRIVNEGHVIGNHSYSHSELLSKMPPAEFQADVRHAENLIVSATGLHPRYYRPPFFSHTPSMDQQLTDMGYVVVLGDVGARDWDRGNSSESIVEEIIRKTLKGKKHQHIILLHDGRDVQIGYPRQNVIEALPQIIGQLKEKGYRFVTVEQIIHQSPYLRPQS